VTTITDRRRHEARPNPFDPDVCDTCGKPIKVWFPNPFDLRWRHVPVRRPRS
jgi:hypothetical protein